MLSFKHKLLNLFSSKQKSTLTKNEKNRSKSVFEAEYSIARQMKRYRTISSGFENEIESMDYNKTFQKKKGKDQYRRISTFDTFNRINADDLTLNEFIALISHKIKDKFVEHMKLNELFKNLDQSHYDYEPYWCGYLTIADIKSLLWMDDYELYPKKLKEIKNILDDVRPAAEKISLKQSDSKNNLMYKDEAIRNNSSFEIKSIQTYSSNSNLSCHSPNISSYNSSASLCKICTQLTADAVYIDCGHIVSCTNCSKTLQHCPLCNKTIINYLKTFN